MHVVNKEFCYQVSDCVGCWVAVFESACLVREVAFNHTNNLLARNFNVRLTDAVAYIDDWNRLAERWVGWFVNILDELSVRVVERVKLQDNVLSKASCCRADTACCCQISLAGCFAFFDVADFENSPVNFSHESIAKFHSHVAQMKVVIRNLTCVNALTEIAVCRVRSTILDSISECQNTVGALTSACASEESYFERTSCCVFCFCNFC